MKAPLLDRNLNADIAWVTEPLVALGGRCGTVSTATFLAQVHSLAGKLPHGQHAINLCGNRYLFTLAFCAVIVRGQTNLLPPNRNVATQARLLERYPETFVLHDGSELLDGIDSLNVNNLSLFDCGEANEIPLIPLNHLAAIAFTSGSTGDSKPNLKSWLTFYESTKINKRYMYEECANTVYQLATVPGQHMWGLETSVLLPLFADICVLDCKPLFPADIQKKLQMISGEKLLVSTPVHLRALELSGLTFPTLNRILSATAPLSAEQAEKLEQCFNCQVREVYGCSEVGSMAYRRTAKAEPWTLFEGLDLNEEDQGTRATGNHLPESVLLQDFMNFSDERHFELAGRHADLIEIAGKRGSLQEINKVLLACDGVVDGVVFLPENSL